MLTTIADYNRMTGQETLHPLVTMAKPSTAPHARMMPAFYALIYNPSQASLRLYRPGDTLDFATDDCNGVLFHPDLLCGTRLQQDIDGYPVRCRCHALTDCERSTIADCLAGIDTELHHSIDRFSRPIIVSHIGLLLDYCVRFCDTKCKTDISIRNHDNRRKRKTG